MTFNQTHCDIVEEGGGKYLPGMLMGSLVLFNSPQTGSTLAIPEEKLTAEAVRQRIADSDKTFGATK